MSKTEQDILSKLKSEGLSLDSPYEKVISCLRRCIGAQKLLIVAKAMLAEHNADKFKYKIGEEVFYTNGYGIPFGNKTIIGRELWDGKDPRYYIFPTDTEWYPVGESQLTKQRS
jgi:hypothetical protein